jgi:ribosome maturation factor RimP
MLEDPQIQPLTAVIEPVCAAHGVELVDVSVLREPGGAVLRVLIDRAAPELPAEGETPVGSGVSLADCQEVSRDLSVALDVNEAVAPKIHYRLEVSSPGLDRPLTRRRDFEKYAGKEVRVQTRMPMHGENRRRFAGVLRGIEGDTVRLEDGGATFEIPLTAIAKANVVYKFAEKLKPSNGPAARGTPSGKNNTHR